MQKHPAARQPIPLADQIGIQIDRLHVLQREAANERRPHHRTEELLDGLMDSGTALRRMARG